jgi:hypothetical protein
MNLMNTLIQCGKLEQGKELTIIITDDTPSSIKAILSDFKHPEPEFLKKFDEKYINMILNAKSMNDLKNKIFDILEISKSQVKTKVFWEDVMYMQNVSIRTLKEEATILEKNKVPRKICASLCCTVKTCRLCPQCNKNNVCKKHGTCSTCNGIESVKEPPCSQEVLDRIVRNREKARNHYRIKQGIPLDAPLIQRGGARNIKYHTQEEKAQIHQLDREYQREYQRKYREQKMKKSANEVKE